MFFLAAFPVYAQLNVTLVAFSTGLEIDSFPDRYPSLRAQVRATRGGQPVSLTSDDIFIVERNTVVRPRTVTSIGSGVHLVTWTATGKAEVRRSTGTSYLRIVVEQGGEVGEVDAGPPMWGVQWVSVTDSMRRRVSRVFDYGTIPSGSYGTARFNLFAQRAPLSVESITVDDPRFIVYWQGTENTPAPPVELINTSYYRYDVVFLPTDDTPVVALASINYANGLREDIILTANRRTYPARTILNLLSPNGGESFAACDSVPVRWTGQVPGFRVFVEYTTNNGRSWTLIDSTLDSAMVWEVPDVVSDSMRIRVSQRQQRSDISFLAGERSPATNLAFSRDGLHLAVAFQNGVVVEFSTETRTITNRYTIAAISGGTVNGLTYVGRSRDIVASVRRSSGILSELQAFAEGGSAPRQRRTLPADVVVRQLGSDANGTTIALIPNYGTRVRFLDPSTLDDAKLETVDAPITSAFVRDGRASVFTLSGNIIDFDIAARGQMGLTPTDFVADRFPVIRQHALSADGRFAALGGQHIENQLDIREHLTFLYDRQEGRISRVMYREVGTALVALSFSPNDQFLAVSFQASPQLTTYDLKRSDDKGQTGEALEGHRDSVTDMEYALIGNWLASCSKDVTDNVLIRRFITPELDSSDAMFRVVPVSMTNREIVLPSLLIGTSLDTLVNAHVCNDGDVDVTVQRVSLRHRRFASLPNAVTNVRVAKGECLSFRLFALPLDTGRLEDTLLVETCSRTITIPVVINVRNRNLTIMSDPMDFGDVCVGSTKNRRLAYIRNNDSVPLEIDGIVVDGGTAAQFRVITPLIDSVIPPRSEVEVEIQFAPVRTGLDTSTIIIRYEGQLSVDRRGTVTGRGSGADIRVSHQALPFLPDITERDLVIWNDSDNPLTLTRADLPVASGFTVVTQLPLTIAPRDSSSVRIRFDGDTSITPATVELSFEPCAALTPVELSVYSASTVVLLPTVTADPRGDATIVVRAQLNEVRPYNGVRTVEGMFTVHPQLFIARTATSASGSAEIVSQDVVNGLREIRFRVEGSFTDSTDLVTLVGPAGLSVVDSCELLGLPDARWFGSRVSTTFRNGLLRITNPNPGRVITDKAPTIVRIAPNPAADDVEVVVRDHSEQGSLRIIDSRGNNVSVAILRTEDGFRVGVQNLLPGAYSIVYSTVDGVTSSPLRIIR